MNTKPIFISFYVDFDPNNNYYERSYLNLKKQFDELFPDQKYYFEKLLISNSDELTYDKNCLKKPKFIIETQKKFNSPVIWIDIDSVLRTNDLNFLLNLDEYDVAFILRHENVPESFLMYFNNTQKANNILNYYMEKSLDGEINLDHYAIMEFWKIKDSFDAKIKIFDSSYGSTNPNSKIQLGVSSFLDKKHIEKKVYNYRKGTNRLCH